MRGEIIMARAPPAGGYFRLRGGANFSPPANDSSRSRRRRFFAGGGIARRGAIGWRQIAPVSISSVHSGGQRSRMMQRETEAGVVGRVWWEVLQIFAGGYFVKVDWLQWFCFSFVLLNERMGYFVFPEHLRILGMFDISDLQGKQENFWNFAADMFIFK